MSYGMNNRWSRRTPWPIAQQGVRLRLRAPAIMLTGGRGRRGGGATEINTVMSLRFLADGEGFGWAHRGGSLAGYPLAQPPSCRPGPGVSLAGGSPVGTSLSCTPLTA
jgi:hypothetical protein